MLEIWKPVVGYEGLYKVSNLGKVKACPKNGLSERELKPVIVGLYPSVKLVKDGVYKNKYVHRLVADAFIPNPDNLPEVNHKDEDKMNCSADNLEWCTRRYNVSYGTGQTRRVESYKSNPHKHLVSGENHPKSKLTMEDIRYIHKHYRSGNSVNGARALGRQFGVSHNTIRAVIKGRTWNG